MSPAIAAGRVTISAPASRAASATSRSSVETSTRSTQRGARAAHDGAGHERHAADRARRSCPARPSTRRAPGSPPRRSSAASLAHSCGPAADAAVRSRCARRARYDRAGPRGAARAGAARVGSSPGVVGRQRGAVDVEAVARQQRAAGSRAASSAVNHGRSGGSWSRAASSSAQRGGCSARRTGPGRRRRCPPPRPGRPWAPRPSCSAAPRDQRAGAEEDVVAERLAHAEVGEHRRRDAAVHRLERRGRAHRHAEVGAVEHVGHRPVDELRGCRRTSRVGQQRA